MSKSRYNLLARRNDISLDLRDVTPFSPTIKERDIVRGYIVRYFIQKANDINSIIYEIDRSQYASMSTSPFYTLSTLDWRIVGNPNEVKKSNAASIRIASKVIPKIQLYLPNLLQFHQK